jgi:4-carboxymuconolactone decarboxylase
VMDNQQKQSRLPELREDLLSELQSSVLQRLTATRGRVPTPYRIWIQSPKLAEPLQELGAFLSKEISLSRREYEIAVLLIARHWQAEYVFDVHARDAADAGFSESVIADIRAGSSPELTDPRERLVCDIVRGFAQPTSPDDELFDDALTKLGHKGVAELLVLCGYFTSVSLAMKLYRVSPG